MSHIDLFMEQLRGIQDSEGIMPDMAYQFKNLGEAHQSFIKKLMSGSSAYDGFYETLSDMANNLTVFDRGLFDTLVATSGLGKDDKDLLDSIANSKELFGIRQKLIIQGKDNGDYLRGIIAGKIDDDDQRTRILNAISLGDAIETVGEKSKEASKETAGLWSQINFARKTNPFMFWASAISMGATALALILPLIIKTKKEIIEAGTEAEEAIAALSNKFNEQNKVVKESGASYAKLAQGVNQLTGANETLSTEDYEEYLRLSNEIANTMPDLVAGYDAEGNAILDLQGDYETINTTLEEYIELQRKANAEQARDELGDVAKKAKVSAKEYRKNISSLESELDYARGIYENAMVAAADGNTYLQTAFLHSASDMKYLLDLAGVEYTSSYQQIKNGNILEDYEILDFDTALAARKIEAYFSQVESKIVQEGKKVPSAYAELNKDIVVALGDNEIYNKMSASHQSLLQRILFSGEIDWQEDFGLTDADSILSFVESDLLNVVTQYGSAAENAFDKQTLFNKNKLSVGEYRDEVSTLIDTLNATNVDPAIVSVFQSMFELPNIDFGKAANRLAGVFKGSQTFFAEFLDSLTGKELDAFLDWMNEVELSSYDTWEGALAAFEAYKHEVLTLTSEDVFTDFFSNSAESIEAVSSKISSLSESYKKLQSGELKLPDVMSLVSEYPELIKYVDLADESFGRLDEGLIHLLRNSPKDLIDELKEFKETNELTDEAAEAVDNFIGELEDMPADAIEGISDEFGIMADSIRKSRQELTQLEEALEAPDYDDQYNTRVENFASLVEAYEAGEVNSKHYKALLSSFNDDLLTMSNEEVGQWIEVQKKFWGESADVATNFFNTVASMDGAGQTLEGIASFEDGVFWYDHARIEEFAAALGLSEGALQSLIDKLRMYYDISTGAEGYLAEFTNEGFIKETETGTIASLSTIMDYTKKTKEEVVDMFRDINALDGVDIQLLDDSGLREWEGWSDGFFDNWKGWSEVNFGELNEVRKLFNSIGIDYATFKSMLEDNNFKDVLDPLLTELGWAEEEIEALYAKIGTPVAIEFQGIDELNVAAIKELFGKHDITLEADADGALEVTQEVVDQMLGLQMTALEVKAILDDLSGVDGIKVGSNLDIGGIGYNVVEAPADENVSETRFTGNTEDFDEKSAHVDTERTRQEADPVDVAFESNASSVETEAKKLKDTLYDIPTDIEIKASFKVENVPNFSQGVKNNADFAPTFAQWFFGSNAKGTNFAHEGLSLLGDEYSPTGTPKPELVVSDGYAYLAGVNGPTIGYLHEGDQVYTASETKKILGSMARREIDAIPAFAKGNLPINDGGTSINPVGVKNYNSTWQALQAIKAVRYEAEVDLKGTGGQQLGEEVAKDIEEELKDELDKLKEELDEILGDFEHEIFLGEKNGNMTSEQMVALYKKAQKEIAALADKYREMGLDENSDYIQDLQKQWWEYQDEIVSLQQEKLEEQHESLQTIFDLAQDYVKWEHEQTIDALEDQKDVYAEIIERKKEIIELTRREREHEDSLAEKIEEIAELQNRIDLLALDDSREAQAEKAQLERELNELQKELSSDQWDYAVEIQTEALDKELEAFEEEKDAEIEALEGMLDSAQELYDATIAYIENNWDSLYGNLKTWNAQYGNLLTTELEAAWGKALAAAEEYGSFVQAMDYTNPESENYKGNNVGVTYETARSIAWQMYSNSQAWHKDVENRAHYVAENERLAEDLATVYGKEVKKNSSTGVWTIDGQNIYELFGIEVHHSGGVAGNQPTLKQDEVLSILKKGEPVLDEQSELGLYKLVDFAQLMAERLSAPLDFSWMGNVISGFDRVAQNSIRSATNNSSSVGDFAPHVEVNISHSGELSARDAKKYGEVAADAALSKLKDAFTMRGVSNFSGALLKP